MTAESMGFLFVDENIVKTDCCAGYPDLNIQKIT